MTANSTNFQLSVKINRDTSHTQAKMAKDEKTLSDRNSTINQVIIRSCGFSVRNS
ncbi:hypothetical protein [Nostoc sp. 106C]|uniref:hypothetical protein n=1 Tax=Nostoc sp. 106C TaxID=1932667 RepID=UPI0014130D3E|nr:hypothetical protein [Nostoc sp. 106C]